jgi:hypothetical protein
VKVKRKLSLNNDAATRLPTVSIFENNPDNFKMTTFSPLCEDISFVVNQSVLQNGSFFILFFEVNHTG